MVSVAAPEMAGEMAGNTSRGFIRSETGAVFLRTATELILRSRRVVPERLLDDAFRFTYATWRDAATELCERWRRCSGARNYLPDLAPTAESK